MREWSYTASSRDGLYMGCISLKIRGISEGRGMFWVVHPLGPQDFPRPSRCSSGHLSGFENILVLGDVQLNTSLLSAIYGYNRSWLVAVYGYNNNNSFQNRTLQMHKPIFSQLPISIKAASHQFNFNLWPYLFGSQTFPLSTYSQNVVFAMIS